MGTNRPVIHDLKRSKTDVMLEALALAGVVFLIAVPAYYYSHMPDSIPQHFNFKGEADGWGGKAGLLLMPVMGVFLYAILTVLSRFPHVFNYPWAITEANARRQYTISRQMLSVVKLDLVATFSYITWATIGTALGTQKGLNGSFTIIEAPILLAIIGFYLFKAKRAQ